MTARGGRRQQLKESIGSAREHPSAKQQHEQQSPKQQREQERSLRRLHDFQQTKACGARWEPLVQKLLRKERATSRAQVWTGHLERRIALRKKMRAFLGRALRHASSSAHPARVVDRDKPAQSKVSGALAAGWLRRLATCYRVKLDVRAAFRTMLTVALRNFLLGYIRGRDVEKAHAELRMQPDLGWSPPGRQRTTCPRPPPEPSPDEQRGATRLEAE